MKRIAAVLVVFSFGAGSALAAPSCPAAPSMRLTLPATRAALARHRPITIVAFGSSSTWGTEASDQADSYPAELQDELYRLMPTAEISVLNRGIGGQDARREDLRLSRDVLAVQPNLVIWQVGANAAMRGESVESFRDLVSAGLARLSGAHVDIVLMDNQRSRRVLASPTNTAINESLAALARGPGVSLFSRDRLMRSWAESAPLDEFLARDGTHMNDRGYACLAHALARAISSALPQPSAQERPPHFPP